MLPVCSGVVIDADMAAVLFEADEAATCEDCAEPAAETVDALELPDADELDTCVAAFFPHPPSNTAMPSIPARTLTFLYTLIPPVCPIIVPYYGVFKIPRKYFLKAS